MCMLRYMRIFGKYAAVDYVWNDFRQCGLDGFVVEYGKLGTVYFVFGISLAKLCALHNSCIQFK